MTQVHQEAYLRRNIMYDGLFIFMIGFYLTLGVVGGLVCVGLLGVLGGLLLVKLFKSILK